MTNSITLILVLLTLGAPLLGRWGFDPVVDRAYENFLAGRFGQVFGALYAYRFEHVGTLRVDFMLAVSACNNTDQDVRALGGYLLYDIPRKYRLDATNRDHVAVQADACPRTIQSRPAGIARLKAKFDAFEKTDFHAGYSEDGQGEPLPATSVTIPPPPSQMSGLLVNQVYQGGSDFLETRTASADQCSAQCRADGKCVAMTFSTSDGKCWLKHTLTTLAASGNFVSAYKIKR